MPSRFEQTARALASNKLREFGQVPRGQLQQVGKVAVYRELVDRGVAGGVRGDVEGYPEQAAPVDPIYPMHTRGAEPARSFLGTPIWVDLQLQLDSTSGPLVIDTVLATVEQEKTIVRTAVQGRVGTVKEYVTTGDYVVTLAGRLYTDTPGLYPLEAVQQLRAIAEADYPTLVISPFLQLFDIYEVVWEGATWPQSKIMNLQEFELRGYSSTPIQLVDDVQAR